MEQLRLWGLEYNPETVEYKFKIAGMVVENCAELEWIDAAD